MNRLRKEQLKERFDRLDANEHAQIFQMVSKYTDKITKTQNGALVSSDILPDDCMIEMEKMVTFYLEQHKQMESDALVRKSFERR